MGEPDVECRAAKRPRKAPKPVHVTLRMDQHGRVLLSGDTPDYSFRSFPRFLPRDWASLQVLKDDCATVFTARSTHPGGVYSAGSTYWIGADETPTTALEKLALEIFSLHAGQCSGSFDVKRSGAEWWTLAIDQADEVGWHWDRDYELEDSVGFYVHPHLSTVTYLTDGGAPTLILEADGSGTDDSTQEVKFAHVSHPRVGKHVCFDGRFLHSAVSEFAQPGTATARVTFLVNVWLNHRPLSVERNEHTSLLQTSALMAQLSLDKSAVSVPRVVSDSGPQQSFTWYFQGRSQKSEDEEDGESEEEEEEENDDDDEGEGTKHEEANEDVCLKGRRCVRLTLPRSVQASSATLDCLTIDCVPGAAEVSSALPDATSAPRPQ